MHLRLFILALLCTGWLLPFFWAGWQGRLPLVLPRRLAFQYSAAGLFTKRMSAWTQMHIQLQRRGDEEWRTIDTAEAAPMGAFGYRQRLDRMLQETNGRRVADSVRQRMTRWIVNKHQTMHPEAGEIGAVRFAQSVWPVSTPGMAHPMGAWVPNPQQFPADVRFVSLAVFTIPSKTPQPAPMRTPAAFARKP